MGSLRSSIHQLNILGEAASSKGSKFKVSKCKVSRLQSFKVSKTECSLASVLYVETLKP